MLFIDGNQHSDPIEWHVGEPLPEIKGRVVLFQADGDELEFIKRALENEISNLR